jgi:hypothetical protein
VFDFVPAELAVGDSVSVDSKKRRVEYFYAKENKQFEGRLMMIRDETDINFVHENSKLE